MKNMQVVETWGEGHFPGRPKMLGEDNIKMNCWDKGYDGR